VLSLRRFNRTLALQIALLIDSKRQILFQGQILMVQHRIVISLIHEHQCTSLCLIFKVKITSKYLFNSRPGHLTSRRNRAIDIPRYRRALSIFALEKVPRNLVSDASLLATAIDTDVA
jgi:hypothetical protein